MGDYHDYLKARKLNDLYSWNFWKVLLIVGILSEDVDLKMFSTQFSDKDQFTGFRSKELQ